MSTIASQITNLTIVYSTVYSDADQSKHQSSASLAFVRGQMASDAENVSIWWRHHDMDRHGKGLDRFPNLPLSKLPLYKPYCLWTNIKMYQHLLPFPNIDKSRAVVIRRGRQRQSQYHGSCRLSDARNHGISSRDIDLVTPEYFGLSIKRFNNIFWHRIAGQNSRGSVCLRFIPTLNTLRPRKIAPFRRRHFQMHFLERKCMNLD